MQKTNRRDFVRMFAAVLASWLLAVSFSAGQTSKKSTSVAAATDKVDLNTASEKDLESLPGVGPATAKKIIAGRPFSSVGDLSKAGVPAATISKITPLVSVGDGSGASTAKSSTPPPAPAPAPSKNTPPSTAKASPAPVSQGTPGPGNVWVNLDSGVYHYNNSRYYGKTKNGKYMSEADAISSGYHAAKNEKKPQ